MDSNRKLREMVIAKMESGDFELKPCPFCGEQPSIMDKETFERLKEADGDNRACITIKCGKCHLDFYDHTSDERDYFVRKFLVIEKWNRRAK